MERRRRLLKEKRGDIPDILSFLIVIFILALGFFLLAFIIPIVANGLGTAGLNETSEGFMAIEETSKIGTVTIQRGFFLLFVGLIIGVMITSFLSRTHPIFLFLYIIFLIISVVLATFLGNFYELFVSVDIFADTLAEQTLINLVMNNILQIVIGVAALSFIIVFAKFKTGGVTDRL